MDNTKKFGIFFKEKRCEKELSLRTLSHLVELSHSYLYNIEKGVKAPPSDKKLRKIASVLNLDDESKTMFFEMAAESKATFDKANYYVPIDVSEYITKEPSIKTVLREASNQSKTSDFWDNLSDELKK